MGDPAARRGAATVWAPLIGALAAAVLLVSCGSADPEPQAEPSRVEDPLAQSRRAGAEPVLAQWAQALTTGDTQLLETVIDPGAPDGVLAAQQARATAAADLDFTRFELVLGDDPDVYVRQEIADRIGADDVWAPPLYLEFQLAGVDEYPMRTKVGAILAKRGEDWTVVSVDETADSMHPSWPAGPWEFGPVLGTAVPVDRAGESLILSHPGDEAQAAQLAEALPDAIARVTDFWGADWDRTVVLEIAADQEEFGAITGQADPDSVSAAAAIVYESDRPGHGQRIVFAPGAIERMDEFQLGVVLRHELSHVATRADTGRGAPGWLIEGTGDYVGFRGTDTELADAVPAVASMVATHGAPDSLPEDVQYTGPMADLAYQLGRTMIDYIVTAYDEDRLIELHDRLGDGGRAPEEVDEIVQEVLGVSMNRLTSDWSVWLGETFG